MLLRKRTLRHSLTLFHAPPLIPPTLGCARFTRGREGPSRRVCARAVRVNHCQSRLQFIVSVILSLCPLEGSPPCEPHVSRFLPSCALFSSRCALLWQHGLILVRAGLGPLHYEFLRRSAPTSGTTFPLNRASLGGKV